MIFWFIIYNINVNIFILCMKSHFVSSQSTLQDISQWRRKVKGQFITVKILVFSYSY